MHDGLLLLVVFPFVVAFFLLCDLLACSRLATYLYVCVSIYILILVTTLEDYVRRRR